MKGPKQIQLQTANQLLTDIRSRSQSSYQRVCHSLEAWDRDEQDKQCYQRIQEALKMDASLVHKLNAYVEEDVHFKHAKSTQEMVDEYMHDLNQNNPQAFTRAFKKLGQLQDQNITDDNRIFEELIDLFRDEPEVHRRLVEICSIGKDQELVQEPPKKKKERQAPTAQTYRLYEQRNRKYADLYEDEGRARQPVKESSSNPSEESYRFHKLRETMGAAAYESFIKVVYLYEIGVLSRVETLAQLPQRLFESPENCDFIYDAIEARDGDRRRTTNVFKSLTDLNYNNCDRTGYSYMQMPEFYPIVCSGKAKNPELNQILNVKWVILPIGSEHPNEFSVRPNNPYEDPLFRSEYERYEFDVNLYRYRQTAKLLERSLNSASEAEGERLMLQAVSLGCLQPIYRAASKQQKEQIEVGLLTHRQEMSAAILERVKHQIRELENIRAGPGMKTWIDVCEKNFFKSMDRRSYYFKFNERNLTKIQTIVESLDNVKSGAVPTVFNTFDGLSRMERVNHHYPKQLNFTAGNPNNPFMVLYYENVRVLAKFHEMIRDYMDAQPPTVDKINVKRFFDEFMFPFVGEPERDVIPASLPADFDYEKVKASVEEFLPIKEVGGFDPEIHVMLDVMEREERSEQLSPSKIKAHDVQSEQNKHEDGESEQPDRDRKICVLKSENGLQLLPPSAANSRIFYGSQTFYTLLRLFYFAYQKLVRAYELCNTFSRDEAFDALDSATRKKIAESRFHLFVSVFIANIKSKDYNKLEENFKEIFGQCGYVFFSIVKLFEGVFKTAQACVSDGFTSELVRLYDTEKECEEIYLAQANQMSLLYSNSGRIIRIVANPDGLMYLNLLESIYRGWFADKKDQKEQSAWSRVADRLESYLLPNNKKGHQHPHQDESRKKQEVPVMRNCHQHLTAPKSLQLVSLGEDFLCRRRRLPTPVRKSHLKEAKRASKLRAIVHESLVESLPASDI